MVALNFGEYVGDWEEIRKAAIKFWNARCKQCSVHACTAHGIVGSGSIYQGEPNAPSIKPVEYADQPPLTLDKMESPSNTYVVSAGIAIPKKHENNSKDYIRKAACNPQQPIRI